MGGLPGPPGPAGPRADQLPGGHRAHAAGPVRAVQRPRLASLERAPAARRIPARLELSPPVRRDPPVRAGDLRSRAGRHRLGAVAMAPAAQTWCGRGAGGGRRMTVETSAKESVLLVLDIGTSEAKGGLVTADGRMLGAARAGYAIDFDPLTGRSEQDPRSWWRA